MSIKIDGKIYTLTKEEMHILYLEEACSRLIEVEDFEYYQAKAIYDGFKD